MKKNTIIYILLALSGYVFLYMSIWFIEFEYNIANWGSMNRTAFIVFGTVMGILAMLVKNSNKP